MNLFIVESPFQLVSAIEANAYFEDNSTLIIKYNTEKENDAQLKRIINEFSNFQNIIEVVSTKSNNDANIKLFFLLKSLQRENKIYHRVFIGEYRSFHMRKFFDVLNPQECYLLDDGNITISMVKYISKQKDQYYFGGIRGKIKELLYGMEALYLGLTKYKIRRDISVFTCFNIVDNNGVKVIKHNFEYFKSSSDSNFVHDVVYFYGSNLKELGITYALEVHYLQYVIDYYNDINLELVYIPHRRDARDKLEMIKNRLNVKIKKNTYPAEIELILDKIQPRHICSFVSSVLITLPSIYDFESVISFFFPLDSISSEKYRTELIDIKEEYKKNIKIVEIPLKEKM